MKPPSFSRESLHESFLAIIQAQREKVAPEMPKDFKSAAQWAKEWGMSVSATKLNLDFAVEQGLAEAREFKRDRQKMTIYRRLK